MESQDHLKCKLPPMKLQIPHACNLSTERCLKRIDAEAVSVVLKCIAGIDDDAPTTLNVKTTTGIIGSPGDEFCECCADQYNLAFFVRDGAVTNCFRCITPSGSGYDINKDGGNPFIHLTNEEQRALTSILLPKRKGRTVEVVPAWIICINGARPYCGGHLFYDRSKAEEARDEQEEYYNKYNRPKSEIAEEKKIEKEKIRESASVPFAKRGKKSK